MAMGGFLLNNNNIGKSCFEKLVAGYTHPAYVFTTFDNFKTSLEILMKQRLILITFAQFKPT